YGQRCLAPLLPEFMALCPDIEMQLDLSDRIVDLGGEPFDMAIRIATTIPLGLVTRPLGRTANLLWPARGTSRPRARRTNRTTSPGTPACAWRPRPVMANWCSSATMPN